MKIPQDTGQEQRKQKQAKRGFHSMIDIYRVTNMGKVNTHREIKRGQTNTAE